jgi:hypothetical protein
MGIVFGERHWSIATWTFERNVELARLGKLNMTTFCARDWSFPSTQVHVLRLRTYYQAVMERGDQPTVETSMYFIMFNR